LTAGTRVSSPWLKTVSIKVRDPRSSGRLPRETGDNIKVDITEGFPFDFRSGDLLLVAKKEFYPSVANGTTLVL